jgi:enediyne biosynthesis protein E7
MVLEKLEEPAAGIEQARHAPRAPIAPTDAHLNCQTSRMSSVPGPRGAPGLGMLPHLARDPLRTCLTAQRRYGDVVRLPVLWGEVFLLTHPDHVERVLVANNANYWKGRLFRRADFLFGDGLVLNDGESWHRQRRVLQPGFHADRMAAAVPAIEGVVEERAARWRQLAATGDPVDMEHEMTTLTLDLMATAMLGTRLTAAELRDLGAAFGVVLSHLGLRFATFTLPERTRLPGETRARRALTTIDRIVRRIIADRTEPRDDVLDLLLAATRDGAMSPRLLRDEIVTLLFGGYEATAHALAWTWYELDRNPDVADRVRTDEDGTFTRWVVDEILRLYPPFWEVLRSSHGEDRFGDHVLPAGASVLLVPWVTHRHPDFWDEPEHFDPSRWQSGPPAHRHAYFPFAAGQRMCIGRPLARLELELVVRRLSQEFRPRLVPGHQVRVRAQSTLRSRHGIPMTLEPVRPSDPTGA